MCSGRPFAFPTVSIIAGWNNSDALGAQIFGSWNELVTRNLGLRGLDRVKAKGRSAKERSARLLRKRVSEREVSEKANWEQWRGILGRGQGAALRAGLQLAYLWVVPSDSTPARKDRVPGGPRCRLHSGLRQQGSSFGAAFIHRTKVRCFCRASLARGGRWVGRDLISPRSQNRDLGHPANGL